MSLNTKLWHSIKWSGRTKWTSVQKYLRWKKRTVPMRYPATTCVCARVQRSRRFSLGYWPLKQPWKNGPRLHLLRSLTNLINMQSVQYKPINDGTNKNNIAPNQTEPDADIHKWTHIVVIKCLFYIFISSIRNGCWKVLAIFINTV